MHASPRTPAALAAVVVVAMSATAIPAASGAGANGPAADLRRQQTELERQSASAILELYALETQLAGARHAADEALRRQQRLEAEQTQLEERLALARRDAERAEAMRADRLRALYEAGGVDALAVVLGAQSLDDALTQLEGLRFVAEADERMVAETRASRESLEAARRELEERRLEAAEAAASAVAHAAAAERARANAAAYADELAEERRLTAGRIATLERQARAARERAEALAPAAAATAAPPAAPQPAPAPVAAELAAGGGRTLTVVATAYALPGRTATGIPVGPGVVAVDPSVIPLGTRMTVPGYGDGFAADVGGSIKGNRIDVWFPTVEQALRWGRRTVTITLQ